MVPAGAAAEAKRIIMYRVWRFVIGLGIEISLLVRGGIFLFSSTFALHIL
jgi:hypothetical protein